MKHLVLSAICALCLTGCGGPPSSPNKTAGQNVVPQEIKIPAPTIKVYVENSGSMDGYVKGATDFENAVYSFLSDVQHADLGNRPDSMTAKNVLILNYINSEVLQQKPDVREFIKALEPADFKMKGGKRGTSDMSNIIGTIISQTGNNDVSIMVSDCIFSPGKTYKAKDNADEYIVAQQIGIKSHIVEELVKNPNFSIVVMRLMSQFDGIYYNKFDDGQYIKNNRPFYIWLMGDRTHLKTILNKVDINQIKGNGVQNIFMISNSLSNLPYSISLPQPGNGKYKLDNETKTITDAKTDGKGGNSHFQISLSVDFSKLLLPETYLMNPDNYIVSNKAYGLEISKYSGPNTNKYTHTIKLTLLQPVISRGAIKISLLNTMPSWVKDCTDDIGLDINTEGAMEKTYGLKYLLDGVHDAYSSNGQYGSITINIK